MSKPETRTKAAFTAPSNFYLSASLTVSNKAAISQSVYEVGVIVGSSVWKEKHIMVRAAAVRLSQSVLNSYIMSEVW